MCNEGENGYHSCLRRETKSSKVTLTTSVLKQGHMGMRSPGPGRLWRQAEPGSWGKMDVAMLWKARWRLPVRSMEEWRGGQDIANWREVFSSFPWLK